MPDEIDPLMPIEDEEEEDLDGDVDIDKVADEEDADDADIIDS